MANRRFLNQLGERESVDQVFLVADKQLRANRSGNLYLQVRLSDRTGSLNGMLWNANEAIYGSFENGDYARVQGTTQYYNGALQMILTRIEPVPASTVTEADFVTLGRQQIERLAARLAELLRGMSNPQLASLAECFLVDEPFMARFTRAPAGIKNHHAYWGGLLQHVVGLMEVVTAVAPHYPELDPNLLLMGAFLHDIGKIDELVYDRELAYSDEVQLVGHLVLAVRILEEKVQQAEQLSGEEMSPELILRLKHMILSHHGQYEFGSPKLPMTPEAMALHYLDTLDAHLHQVNLLLQSDTNTDSPWTPFQAGFGRKFFKGSPRRENGQPSAVEGSVS